MEIPHPLTLLCAWFDGQRGAQLTELSERSVIAIFGKIRRHISVQ